MTNALCIIEGCPDVGIFPYRVEDEGGQIVEGLACFRHDQTGTAPAAQDVGASSAAGEAADDVGGGAATLADVELDDVTFDEDVTVGLAAMLLEHVAMAMQDEPEAVARAMTSLAANTALSTEIASGVLLAMTWLAAAGRLDDEAILLGAELYERQADNGDTPEDDELDDELDDESATGDEAAPEVGDVLDDAADIADELAAHLDDGGQADAELDADIADQLDELTADTIPADGAQSDQTEEGA